jgi:hypothetical protein
MFQHRRHNRLRVNPRHLELETQAVGLSSCFREATMEPCEKRQYTQVFPMTRGILLLVYLTVIAPPVFAQANSFLRQLQRSGLVQEDINIMAHAGSELYISGKAEVGADTIWSNPATGAYGMVEVLALDGQCVRLAYKFQTSRFKEIQTLTAGRCLVDGSWILSP